MRQVLYKTRRKELPKLPPSFSDIVIPDHLQNSATNERFLQKSAEIGDKKIFIFTTPKLMECLCRSSAVFVDGTFYCAPSPFSQLYTLHGTINGQTLPLDLSYSCWYAPFVQPTKRYGGFWASSNAGIFSNISPGANKILLFPFWAIIMETVSYTHLTLPTTPYV